MDASKLFLFLMEDTVIFLILSYRGEKVKFFQARLLRTGSDQPQFV